MKSADRHAISMHLEANPYFGDVWKCLLHQGGIEINTSRQDKREMDGALIDTKPGYVRLFGIKVNNVFYF